MDHLVRFSGPCHSRRVGPTNIDAARISSRNVHVPRNEFLAVWREASRRETAQTDQGVDDWYVGAVVETCRWMAATPMRTALCGGLPRSPVTRRACLAREQLIEAEAKAAQRQEQFSPDLTARPGWGEGVRATFRWAWCREGPPPIEVPNG